MLKKIISSLFLLLSFGLFSQEDSVSSVVFAHCDKLLATISVDQGVEVDWSVVDELFIPDAKLTMVGVNGGKSISYSFGLDRFKAVDNYTKNGFEEKALSREIWTTPNMAVVKEEFKAVVKSTGEIETGVNFYTFIYVAGEWRIKTLAWESFKL
jgi:hypothetical protein